MMLPRLVGKLSLCVFQITSCAFHATDNGNYPVHMTSKVSKS